VIQSIRTERLERDELWSFVGKKQKNVSSAISARWRRS
jgi:hypothetical protein